MAKTCLLDRTNKPLLNFVKDAYQSDFSEAPFRYITRQTNLALTQKASN